MTSLQTIIYNPMCTSSTSIFSYILIYSEKYNPIQPNKVHLSISVLFVNPNPNQHMHRLTLPFCTMPWYELPSIPVAPIHFLAKMYVAL